MSWDSNTIEFRVKELERDLNDFREVTQTNQSAVDVDTNSGFDGKGLGTNSNVLGPINYPFIYNPVFHRRFNAEPPPEGGSNESNTLHIRATTIVIEQKTIKILNITGTTTVTVTTTIAHGLTNGQLVDIEDTTNFNVTGKTITVTSGTTFTYSDAGNATSETSGTVIDKTTPIQIRTFADAIHNGQILYVTVKDGKTLEILAPTTEGNIDLDADRTGLTERDLLCFQWHTNNPIGTSASGSWVLISGDSTSSGWVGTATSQLIMQTNSITGEWDISGGQTNFTNVSPTLGVQADLDMNTYDIKDVCRLGFELGGTALQSTISGITADTTKMHLNVPSGDQFVFTVSGTPVATIDSNGLDAGDIGSGTVNVARLGSGANSTKFLRGDNTWQTVSGGGGITNPVNANLSLGGYQLQRVTALFLDGSGNNDHLIDGQTTGISYDVDTTSDYHIFKINSIEKFKITNILTESSTALDLGSNGIQNVAHILLNGAGTNDLLIDGNTDGLEYKVPSGDEHQFFVNNVERMNIKSTHTNIENYIDIRSPTTTSPTNTAYTGIVGWFKIKIAGGDYRIPVWNAP